MPDIFRTVVFTVYPARWVPPFSRIILCPTAVGSNRGASQPDTGWQFGNRASLCRLHLKCDGTRAETRFRFMATRTSPFKSAGGVGQFSRLLAAEVCASAVVMLDTPCSVVVWTVLATHSIRQFPPHFPSRASPCAITYQLDSNLGRSCNWSKWLAVYS
jgi:hypothetical protein